jgi:hypothetical protein
VIRMDRQEDTNRKYPSVMFTLLDCDGLHFLVRGLALEHFVNAVLQQGCHSFRERHVKHLLGLGFALNKPFHLVGAEQQLMEGDPTL